MLRINAQTDKRVNAETVNSALQAIGMARQAQSEPSAFWKRLSSALSDAGLATSQNGVATMLDMSQGSVGRWFHGEGLPELETCRDLAEKTGVCIDWLLTGRKPRYPISANPTIKELFEICEDLSDEGIDRILRMARGELIQQQGEFDEQQKRAAIGGNRRAR